MVSNENLLQEEEQNVCKWVPESAEFIQPECKPNAFLKYNDSIRAGFKFCPYCGKKIKQERQ
ncbi:hypothetical protein SIL73_13060 [Acidithiobacillus thiooxidans]|uniref:hypothetical protein n=1 Tax=Acidithiobacillus thiooxidans TaxID=930 RepID=UPI0029C319DF|nr:hypothetical protein [Acidithiobacillus thiooxidans]MDX5935619.1 hypothetical protein [Acidithiobacillus thiooxidans]